MYDKYAVLILVRRVHVLKEKRRKGQGGRARGEGGGETTLIILLCDEYTRHIPIFGVQKMNLTKKKLYSSLHVYVHVGENVPDSLCIPLHCFSCPACLEYKFCLLH